MLVTRRGPRATYDPFDRAFQQLTAGLIAPVTRRATPAVDAGWKGDSLELTVDLPGVPRDAVSVEVSDRTLTIRVEHQRADEHLRWSRSVTLGGSLDPDAVTARYADGRLTVVVPPATAPAPRVVPIGDAPIEDAGELGPSDDASATELTSETTAGGEDQAPSA